MDFLPVLAGTHAQTDRLSCNIDSVKGPTYLSLSQVLYNEKSSPQRQTYQNYCASEEDSTEYMLSFLVVFMYRHRDQNAL